MNICVIGGSGFIGTHLIDILCKHHNVTNVDKNLNTNHEKCVTNIKADVRDFDALKKAIPDNTDYVVLLAAEHRDDVSPTSLYYDVNVDGTENVLKVMYEKNIQKIIFTSSVAVYGLNKENPDEFSSTDPFNHYGKSKLAAEVVLHNWYNKQTNTSSLIIVRPTVTFGVGNKGNVYQLLQQIASGKFIMIGGGKNKKSMAYVENVAGFISHCIEKNLAGYQLFNYIDKPDLSTKELVSISERALNKKIIPLQIPYFIGFFGGKLLDIIAMITKRKFSISAVRVQKFCATTQFTSVNIQQTNYQPKKTLTEGLAITIKSIKNK